jgi:hypothetical protein
MRNYIQEEPDEFQQIEPLLQIFRKQLHYLDLMLLNIAKNRVDIEFLYQALSCLISQLDNLIDEPTVCNFWLHPRTTLLHLATFEHARAWRRTAHNFYRKF